MRKYIATNEIVRTDKLYILDANLIQKPSSLLVYYKIKNHASVIADAPTSFYISKKMHKMALLHILKFVTQNDSFFTDGHHIYKKRFLTLCLC